MIFRTKYGPVGIWHQVIEMSASNCIMYWSIIHKEEAKWEWWNFRQNTALAIMYME